MPKSKKSVGGEKPPRAPRQPSKKQPPKELKPNSHEEDFEHTLRRLVIARDGLGRV